MLSEDEIRKISERNLVNSMSDELEALDKGESPKKLFNRFVSKNLLRYHLIELQYLPRENKRGKYRSYVLTPKCIGILNSLGDNIES